MSVERLLERLDGVRANGAGKWSARCPAHDDKSPSLSVQEKQDGTVLVYCFAGCEFRSIVDAVGISPSELFPAGSARGRSVGGESGIARDVLRGLAAEVRIVALAAADVASGRALTVADAQRVAEAGGRINAAWRYVHEHR